MMNACYLMQERGTEEVEELPRTHNHSNLQEPVGVVRKG